MFNCSYRQKFPPACPVKLLDSRALYSRRPDWAELARDCKLSRELAHHRRIVHGIRTATRSLSIAPWRNGQRKPALLRYLTLLLPVYRYSTILPSVLYSPWAWKRNTELLACLDSRQTSNADSGAQEARKGTNTTPSTAMSVTVTWLLLYVSVGRDLLL